MRGKQRGQQAVYPPTAAHAHMPILECTQAPRVHAPTRAPNGAVALRPSFVFCSRACVLV